ncbi:MAG: GPO family capsid scaffolding protein [Candidatus Reddybacter sp.]
MSKSKFFRVAVEGQTTDSRVITREQIVEMADGYNPEKYGARIWLEHFRGVFADGPFQAYGDVEDLRAEEIKDGDLSGKMGLYAQITPTPELIKINKAKQKIYTSIEIDPSFSDSNQAYMRGLGITDSPASLGTEALKFSAQHPQAADALNAKKQKPENLFSSAELVTIEMETGDNPGANSSGNGDDEKTGLFSKVKDLLGRNKKDQDEKFSANFKDQDNAIMAIAEEVQSMKKPGDGDGEEHFKTLNTDFASLKTDFDALVKKLDGETFGQQRPAADGAGDKVLADC